VSPQPTIAHPLGFAALAADIPDNWKKGIEVVRGRVAAHLDTLIPLRAEIVSNFLPDVARNHLLRELKSSVATTAAFYDGLRDHAKQEITAEDVTIQSALWQAADKGKIARIQDRLWDLARDEHVRTPRGRKEAFDPKNGNAMLGAGNAAHRLIDDLICKGTIEDAATVVLAIRQLDPVAAHLLGGAPVSNAALGVLTTRTVEARPELAAAVARRDGLHVAIATVEGDLTTIPKATLRYLDLPNEALNVTRPDPLKRKTP
jgi:hypothetical protein